jgi:hypothetical protein
MYGYSILASGPLHVSVNHKQCEGALQLLI